MLLSSDFLSVQKHSLVHPFSSFYPTGPIPTKAAQGITNGALDIDAVLPVSLLLSAPTSYSQISRPQQPPLIPTPSKSSSNPPPHARTEARSMCARLGIRQDGCGV
ncbi:hypothetical protein K443DRAFT_684545 [Laccaria amethystina LaAM-08-1]|uniref:Uncharacterized protein n=1 Tax=Laccaria amethystina LaAM-08-1 TaxID=1095629 RepID=A0A0C9X763_9AGAR|nr:hypothetical protein K443DRAFT_684545 [Laccaria amethystina LaAM-08-1]